MHTELTREINHLTLSRMALDSTDEGDDIFPRAPTQEEWDRMSPEEQAQAVESLPSEVPWEQWTQIAALPEGSWHLDAWDGARHILLDYFAKIRARVFIASNMCVYYPGKQVFAPDLLVVRDVDGHGRPRWVVSVEGKGLDFVLEVHVGGNRKKDTVKNVERYARLGIPEYFIYDRARQQLDGYRLPFREATHYQPIEPRDGRYNSVTLGLTLQLHQGRLRFWAGDQLLLEHQEFVARLQGKMAKVKHRADTETRLRKEETRLRLKAERLHEKETQRREEETRLRKEETRLRLKAERLHEKETRLREEAERQLVVLQAALKQLQKGET